MSVAMDQIAVQVKTEGRRSLSAFRFQPPFTYYLPPTNYTIQEINTVPKITLWRISLYRFT